MWSAFCSALGVPAAPNPGDRIETSGDGVPPLSGAVDSSSNVRRRRRACWCSTARVRGTRFLAAEGGGDQVACSVFLYLYGDGAEEAGARWSGWMARTFPAPAGVGA